MKTKEVKYIVVDKIRNIVPHFIRKWVRAHIPLGRFDRARLKTASGKFQNEEDFAGSKYRLGILREWANYHVHYIQACRELRVSYRVIDLLADDWIERVRTSGCDAFLVWPSSNGTMIKAAYDMRLKLLEEDMGKLIFPTWKECWLTEYKPRLRDWMLIHNIPHPRTWVFYDEDDALEFCKTAPLPIVVKTATGASGSGVFIARTRNDLMKLAKKFMHGGVRISVFDFWDKQRGYLLLQEYLEGVKEWRMVRVGDSYFGYRKEVGADGKGSGSHKWSWLDPGKKRLDMLRKITEIEGSRSVDVDLFELPDGTLLMNEHQTVFGCTTPATQMKINGVAGRYLFKDGGWTFEEGQFCDNFCCNMRVIELIKQLENGGR